MKTAVVPWMGRVLRHVIHMTYRRRLSIVCPETERFFFGVLPEYQYTFDGVPSFHARYLPFFRD